MVKERAIPSLNKTVNARFSEALKFVTALPPEEGYRELRDMSEGLWLTLGEKPYRNLEDIMWKLHENVADVVHPKHKKPEYEAIISPLKADRRGLGGHIYIMHHLAEIYWTSPAFRKIYPPGTSLNFVKACNYLHDHSRFAGMNALSLESADMTSHALTKKMFPGFPQDKYLHDIRTILGTKGLPDPVTEPAIYVMKAFDTFGKMPRRDMADILEDGGLLDAWIARQKEMGSLSDIPMGRSGVTANKYRTNDREFIKRSIGVISELVPEINFFEALDEAIDTLRR